MARFGFRQDDSSAQGSLVSGFLMWVLLIGVLAAV